MTEAIDLDAYFERIGYAGSRAPTLATLCAIHLHHPQAIAFENLDPILRQLVHLDLASLQQKMLRLGRGGYCYEQNLLLSHVLTALGFHITGLAARVLWNVPEGVTTPRSHMLLRVEIDGQPYIADVGFGGQTLTGPLLLVANREQATPHEPFRLTGAGDEYVLQSKVGTSWKSLYRFDLGEQLPPDYEVSNWYLSTHPKSHFIANLFVARPAEGRRYALWNNQLSIHHLNGPSERHALTTAAELRRTLEEPFGLSLPDTPALDQALARIAATAT